MPIYTYRREDGTTFDLRQKFTDDSLTVDPQTGQHVSRVIQPARVIFKGSGFYVNDSKSASRSTVSEPVKSEKTDKTETTSESKSESKSDTSSSSETKPKTEKASTETVSKPAPAPAAAD